MTSTPASLQQALKTGYQNAECAFDEGILLAVSGGVDSVLLLHATAELLTTCAGRVVVAHVNHRLRGDESEADAEFVAALAQQRGLPFELLTVEDGSLHRNSRGSLEEAARKARYELLRRTAIRLKLSFVATAHHADDQAETILHNIIRGTGLRGLAGMNPSRAMWRPPDTGGNSSSGEAAGTNTPDTEGAATVRLIRPMLAISRTEIDEAITTCGLIFREDRSNRENEFTRNRIRSELLPLLARDFNPQVSRNLISLGEQAAYAARLLDDLADELLNRVLLESSAEICRLDINRLGNADEEVIRHALTRLWSSQNWPRQKMTSTHWKRLSGALTAASNTSFQLPGPIDVLRIDSLLRLTAVARSS